MSSETYDELYHAYPDEPAAHNFVRRANHASLSLGDYVYIDGGEIAMLIDGEPVNMLNNDTLTLDMSKSWTNDSAPFGSINKTQIVPNLNDGFIFPAPDNQSFFQFGGETNWLFNAWLAPPVSIAQFTIDGEGNGSWSEFNAGGGSGFNNITRPARALAATVDDTFFILGGLENSHTSQPTMNNTGSIPIGGITSFNMTSGIWTNSSMPSHLVRPKALNGMLNSVPTFGPIGLLLAAGTGTVDQAPPKFDNITIYEPKNKTWHYQTATGNVPSGRDGACTVGIQGDNGTYEIFMYGGRVNQNGGDFTAPQVQQNINLDAVYVLSLPAFSWFRADYPAKNPRFFHTCQVVGKRQLLSIGGLNALDANADKMSQDQATHGLQIFDLTEMEWSDKYDANAAPYTTPQVIKDWYQKNGTSSVQWEDLVVQNFFAKSLPPKTSSESPSNNTSSNSGSPSTHKSSSTPTGAIVGGVIGGLAAICLLATLIFFYLRHRKRHSQSKSHPYPYKQEMSGTSNPYKSELSDEERRHEADNGQAVLEADGSPRIELDANRAPKTRPELVGLEFGGGRGGRRRGSF